MKRRVSVKKKLPAISIRVVRVFFCLTLPLLVWGLPAEAQTRRVALSMGEVEVLSVRGTVRSARMIQGVDQSDPLFPGTVLNAGDRIHASADGYALLGLVDGTTIELQPGTELEILDFKGGVRELFRIWLGKARLRVRKLVGAPNPYQMHSPIATIGVRGTEFDIEVRPDSVTTVRVYEGLVSVRNNQVAGREVLVGAGREVTVYPLRPPDPPITFEQVVAENFSRESTVEHPLLERFLAFPDPHLDLVDNPAYASTIIKPSGRFYLYPARSESFTSPEISPLNPLNMFTDLRELFATDERRLQGVSSRISYVYPATDWTVGGLYEFRGFDQDFRFRISRQIPTAFGGNVSVEQIGSSRYAPDLEADNRLHRTLFLAARRFPGRTLAFSYDWTQSSGDIDALYDLRPGGVSVSSEESRTLFRTDNRRLTFGYHMESDTLGSVGLYYRFAFLDGEAYQTTHFRDGSPVPPAAFTTRGHSHETGFRWRKRLHPNLAFSLKSALTRTDIDEGIRRFRAADSDRDVGFWIPTAAAGLGFTWRDRFFGALDYQYSNVREQARRWELEGSTLLDSERDLRHHHAFHAWGQYQLPWDFFAGAGVTSFWSNESFRGAYEIDSSGRRTDSRGRPRDVLVLEDTRLRLHQTGFGAGRRFRDRLFLDYQVSRTRGPRFSPLGHAFLLRISF
jgi:hypothetical protein